MQAEAPVPVPPMRRRVVVPMGVGLVVVTLLLRLPAGLPWSHGPAGAEPEVLDLVPYLPPRPAGGPVGELFSGPLGRSGTLLGLLDAVLVLGVFLLVEGLIRRLWTSRNEAAALAVGVCLAALPLQEGLLRVAGGGAVLAGLALLVAGAVLCLGRSRVGAALGGLAAAASPLAHPGLLGLAPLAVLLLGLGGHLRGARRGLLLGVLLLGAAAGAAAWAGAFGGPGGTAPTWPALEGRRLELGLAVGAGAPLKLFTAEPRDLLPTGHAALAGRLPVAAGGFLWLLAAGLGALLAGLAPALWTLGLSAAGALTAALLTPHWVPGEAGLVVAVLLPLLGLTGLVLGAFQKRVARAALLGAALGVALGGFLVQERQAPYLVDRQRVFQLPRRATGSGGSLVAPRQEPDPARLALFLYDIGPQDALAPQVREALGERLMGTVHALHPRRLRVLHESPRALDMPADGGAAGELRRKLPYVSSDLTELEHRLRGGSLDEVFRSVALEGRMLIPRVMAYHYELSGDRSAGYLLKRFAVLSRYVATTARRLGLHELALPYWEVLVQLEPRKPRPAAMLGMCLEMLGEHERAAEVLEEVLGRMDRRHPIAALARGYLGLALRAQGDPQAALKELQAAWSVLAAPGRAAGIDRVPADTEYWFVAELALARCELARELDPALAPQAARDIRKILDEALHFGIRRVPALVFKARLHILEGEEEKALERLRELDEVRAETLARQGDGRRGLMDHPRFRIRGLSMLAELLDPAKDAEELQAVQAELAALEAR